MSFQELVRKTRSYRRFQQNRPVAMQSLRELVDVARLSASGSNLQPLKYIICNDPQRNADVFSTLTWAGYLQNWDGPAEGERPAAYVVILGDGDIKQDPGCDHGIAAQTIALAAAEKGLGACMIGSIQRERLRRELAIEDRYRILLIIALGEPGEEVLLETAGDDIRYWRDEQGVHHVPKRSLEDLILAAYGT